MKHKAHMEIINSKRDRAGNCYFAFIYTDNETGKQARGTISGGDSNISAVELVMNGGKWPRTGESRFLVTRREIAIREFNRFTSDFPYAGCAPEDLAAHIARQIDRKENA